ncbi:MAG: spore germination protein [Acutalibacteraceae bacterium]|nr:spore germination protein [Oscillospiraceae bacterium]
MSKSLTGDYEKDNKTIASLLRADKSYDILVKKIKVADKKATFYGVDGFIKEEVVEKMFEYFTKIPVEDMTKIQDARQFIDNFITYIECDIQTNVDKAVTMALSGALVMLLEGFKEVIIIDARTYPARGVEEPESDKVLRGAHEGFVETLVFNTALIRRKIRDPMLTMELFSVGNKSKTDVIVCYIDGKADEKKLNAVRKKLRQIDVDALSMGQESLKECMMPAQPWNPYPKVRYTERPDTASACIFDGNILIITDGSPSVMIVPTGIFDFVQDINDYYFSPCVGTFLRYIRAAVFLLSFLLVPFWYLMVKMPDRIPEWLHFMAIKEPAEVSVITQIFVIEFVIDVLKLASLNTPSALSNSFSVVGALVLGEFAVSSGLFANEVVLFMAFVAIANFTQPSYELGYAIKLSRLLVLILTALFDVWGFIIGIAATLLTVCLTKTIDGYTYLYPLLPFNKKALGSLLVRKSIKMKMNDDN